MRQTAQFLAVLVLLAGLVPCQTFASGAVYWTSLGLIERCDLDGNNQELILSGAPYLEGITLDARREKIYFCGGEAIWRADVDGTNQEVFVVGSFLMNAVGIALDFVDQRLYWTDSGSYGSQPNGRIWSAGLDGESPEPFLFAHEKAREIAVDTVGRRMYWTEIDSVAVPGSQYGVWRVGLDGGDPEVIVQKTGVTYPGGASGISLDRTFRTSHHEYLVNFQGRLS